MICYYGLILVLWTSFSFATFSTLDQAIKYAHGIQEFPESESDDVKHPDFSAYYRQLKPRWWYSFIRSLGLGSAPLWQPKDVLNTMAYLSTRSLKNLTKGTLERSCAPGDTILVLGDIHGSFHSLVRTLSYWRTIGIIDNSFKIIAHHLFVVCMGNAIDFAPYSLETLSLLIQLLRVNESTFYYIKGVHEDKRTWQDFSSYDELKYRLPTTILLRDAAAQMDIFFASLPTAVIFTLKGTHERLAFTGAASELKDFKVVVKGNKEPIKAVQDLGLRRIGTTPEHEAYWTTVSAPIRLYRMYNNFFYDSYVQISLRESLASSTITLYFNEGSGAYKKGSTYNLVTGALQERGGAVRNVRSYENFNLDNQGMEKHIVFLHSEVAALEQEVAFIQKQLPSGLGVSAKPEQGKVVTEQQGSLSQPATAEGQESKPKSLPERTIQLGRAYNRLVADIANLQKSAESRGLKIEIPKAKTLEEQKNTIVIGSTLDLSKSVKGLGIPFKAGISLKVNEQNQEGGINGKRIEMLFLDDGYIPAVSRRNIERIVNEYHTPFVLAPIGTPTLLASLEIIKEKKVLVLFPQSGSLAFRKPDLTHIVNYRASFDDEGRLLTDFVLKRHLPKNFVFFYQDDEFGISILNGAKRTLKKENVTPGVEVSYLANTTLFHEAAQKIKNANPDAIGFFATGPATLQLIRDLGVEFLANKTLYAVSSVGDEATIKVLKEKGLSIIIGQVVPNPDYSDIEIVKEYREQIKAYGERRNVFSLEAYIVTSITFELMSALKGAITPDELIKKVESLKKYNFKGLTLNFNEKNRSLAHDLWIDPGRGEEWVKQRIAEG